jgi:alanine dehydrogenase
MTCALLRRQHARRRAAHSTYALTNVTLPYVLAIAGAGVEQAVRDDPALALGVNTWDGAVTNGGVAAATGVTATPLASIVV